MFYVLLLVKIFLKKQNNLENCLLATTNKIRYSNLHNFKKKKSQKFNSLIIGLAK